MTTVSTVSQELLKLDWAASVATIGHASVDPEPLLPPAQVGDSRVLDLRIRWRALGQSHESCRQPRRRDYSRASALVHQWMADESGHDERVWPDLKASLDRNRVGQRRLSTC